ncbi:MAG: hypothetical protein WCI41_03050 [bacterium]
MTKIKLFLESEKGKDILVIIIIILVGLASFELGRLSKQNTQNGLKIENMASEANIIDSYTLNKSDLTQNIAKTSNSDKGAYFASKRGKKYYLTDCSAGKTIKEENKIYFSTQTQAKNAGYELSSSCK